MHKRNTINSAVNTDKLIIACLRNPGDCRQSLETTRLPRFNWQLFLKRIFNEGVDGIFFDNISRWGLVSELPEWLSAEIKQNYMRNLGRNLLITTHLENILPYFEDLKIEVLLLRGADFLSRLYPKLGSRMMSDVDIVIHKKDLSKVSDLLESLGYKHPEGYKYLFDNNVLFIDLHVDYIGSYRLAHNPNSPNIKNKHIWQEALSYKTNYSYVKILSVYDAVINCCAHLQEHSFSRLIWFYDIRNIILSGKEGFDWDKLETKAQEYGLAKSVFYVLSYLDINKILDIPPRIMKRLALMKLNGFEKKSLAMLLGHSREDVSGELLFLFANKGIFKKLKCFWQSVFIDKDSFHLAVERITFWHYFKRFFSISFYGFKKLFKLIAV